jgi:hypothetical protein
MPPTDVSSANRRLAGAESFTIAPSKYLGHYVAGNLAARHNITVHLDNSPGNGITATIDLPPTLLTLDEAPPQIEDQGFRGLGMGTTGAGPVLQALPDGALVPAGWDAEPAPDRFTPAAAPPPPEPVPPPPPMPVGRTPSGLVKRAPGNGNGHGNGDGQGVPTTIGADEPSGDLLDRLSRHSANLSPEGRGGRPRTGLWGPLEPVEPAARAPFDVGPVVPAESRVAPGEPAPTAWPPPAAPTRPFPAPGPAGPSEAAPGPFDPWPPTPMPAVGEPPAAWPPPNDWPPAVQAPSEATPLAPVAPIAPATPVDPVAPVAPVAPAAPAAPVARVAPVVPAAPGDATTAGGLTRRVRGAQLPSTEPLRMHRPPVDDGPPPAPPLSPPEAVVRRVAPQRTPEQRRAADEVYSYLSNFSAGVQRGLDESSRSRDA